MLPALRLAALLCLAGCSDSPGDPVAGERELRGYAWSAFEVHGFQECGSLELWWRDDAGRQIPGLTELEAALEPCASPFPPRMVCHAYVELHGEVSPPGMYGHIGLYHREVTVDAVHRVVTTDPSDCPRPQWTSPQ